LENERYCSGLLERKIFGIGEAVDLGAADEFGAAAVDQVAEIGELRAVVVAAGEAGGTFAAGDAGSEENFLAGLHGRDVRAGPGDDTGDVAAGNVRERDRDTRDALAYPEIEMVEGAGVHADEDFAGAEFGFGGVGAAEDVWATVVIEENGFHVGGRILAWTRERGKGEGGV
jgi:hypothetical protein